MGPTNSGPLELKWKNDARWGLRDAQDQGLIKHVGNAENRVKGSACGLTYTFVDYYSAVVMH